MSEMKRFIEARNRYGTTLTALSFFTGLSRGHLSRLFNGKGKPGKRAIDKLEEFFNMKEEKE